MKRAVVAVAVLVGIGMIVIGVISMLQLNALASASTALDPEDTPVVNMIAGDLLSRAKAGQMDPAELASAIQFRNWMLTAFGLLVAVGGVAFGFAGRENKRPDAL